MTSDGFVRSDVPQLTRTVLSTKSIVALSPVGDDRDWAAATAWELARAAARLGRRVALVDLSLHQPALSAGARVASEEGIVDAFMFGASIQHVAREQDVANLHFIPVGSAAARPVAVLMSTRWERLARGFSAEGALLLLYVPPEFVAKLAISLDAIVALAPEGVGQSPPEFRAHLLDRIPLIWITPDRPEPVSEPPPQPAAVGVAPRRLPHIRPFALGSLGLAAAAAITVAVLRSTEPGEATPPVGAEAVDPEPGTSPTAAPQGPPTTVAPAIAVARAPERLRTASDLQLVVDTAGVVDDSLFYSVQTASYASFEPAIEQAAELQERGFPATVSAVRRGPERIWYRVLVGASPTTRSAADLRRQLRDADLLEPDAGVLLRTPHALRIAVRLDPDGAREALAGLRESGIAAYILLAPDGSARVLTGAFETTDQAFLTDSVLPPMDTGAIRTLVTRMGIAR